TLPPSVVSEIPAGAQLIINHHWINVSDKPIKAQVEIITVPPAADGKLIIARSLTVLNTTFELAAGKTAEAMAECTLANGARVLFGWQIGTDKDAICYNGSWL